MGNAKRAIHAEPKFIQNNMANKAMYNIIKNNLFKSDNETGKPNIFTASLFKAKPLVPDINLSNVK